VEEAAAAEEGGGGGIFVDFNIEEVKAVP